MSGCYILLIKKGSSSLLPEYLYVNKNVFRSNTQPKSDKTCIGFVKDKRLNHMPKFTSIHLYKFLRNKKHDCFNVRCFDRMYSPLLNCQLNICIN